MTTLTRNHIFRISNYTPEDIELLSTIDKQMRYIIFGKEICPTTGTPHLQGFVIFKNAKTPQQCTQYFAKLIGREGTHTDPMYKPKEGDTEANQIRYNIEYCQKDKDFIELGEPPKAVDPTKKQGDRSDLLRLKKLIDEGKSYPDILEAEFAMCAKYGRFIRECITARDNALVPKTELDSLFPWEINLIQVLEKPPVDRKIHWVVDTVGGKGKSTFSKYLIDHHNAFYSNGGKGTDVIHAYNNQPVVIFDFAKQAEEYVQYNTIEMLKNGVAFSPKYESQLKRFKVPHVIVFANFYPDYDKIIKDRIIIISI